MQGHESGRRPVTVTTKEPAGDETNDRSARAAWAGYAASAWAFVFAAITFYWVAGGTAGIHTLANSVQEHARDPEFIALTAGTGVLKALAGLIGLALVRPWGRLVPRWLLLTAAWGAGAVLVVYGVAGLVEASLTEAGVIDIPESMGSAAVRWYLFLWKPWYLLGGILFVAAAWHYSRASRRENAQ